MILTFLSAPGSSSLDLRFVYKEISFPGLWNYWLFVIPLKILESANLHQNTDTSASLVFSANSSRFYDQEEDY